MRLKLVPQFLTDSRETLHRSVPWAEDMQDTFFNSDRKCVAMVTTYYWQKWGEKLASQTSPSVFDRFPWNFAQKCALGWRYASHIFQQWQKVCCHGNGRYDRLCLVPKQSTFSICALEHWQWIHRIYRFWQNCAIATDTNIFDGYDRLCLMSEESMFPFAVSLYSI